MGTPSTGVTAGLGGFLALFFIAMACWLLFRSMNKHLRQVRLEAGEKTEPPIIESTRRLREAEQRRAAGRAEDGGAEGSDPSDGSSN